MRYYMHEATSRLLNEGWTFLPQWNGDAHVSIDEIPDLVYSVKEYLGVAPRVIVVDAVSDAVKEQTYDAYSDAFNVLKSEVARRYGCTVISLHHAKKGKHPNVPAHGPDVEFTGYKQPDTVISMYQKPHKVGHSKEDERRRLLILKARDGKSDPSGREWVEFDVEWTRGARFVEKAASRGWTF